MNAEDLALLMADTASNPGSPGYLTGGLEVSDPPMDPTPLATAAHYGHEDACRALLAAGADMSLMDKKDRTALDVAKERNKEACIALLENPPPPVGKNPAIAIAALEESLKEVILD